MESLLIHIKAGFLSNQYPNPCFSIWLKLPMKLHTKFRVVLTFGHGSSGFARISKTTSDVSLVFASSESHGYKTEFFKTPAGIIRCSKPASTNNSACGIAIIRQNETLTHNNFVTLKSSRNVFCDILPKKFS